ncbi:MAG: hypothetical protein A4E34_01509 [Methanoregula sp. PtaU1.Bin006]|nr:MAG: hypothetical protein A4E33_02869 [Methanoregula sp. PtaB.Bin085]OPY33924.1 MAG: hypothetical protein A4E34_01509 [Methanoregula sp. PtaU1.Bin006]
MAGEDLDRIRSNLCRWKYTPVHNSPAAFFRYGSACPAQGCHSCTDPDCPCADYVRHYLNHPRCD